MKRMLGIVPVLIAFTLSWSAFASSFEGPLGVKNQFPIFLLINQPYPWNKLLPKTRLL